MEIGYSRKREDIRSKYCLGPVLGGAILSWPQSTRRNQKRYTMYPPRHLRDKFLSTLRLLWVCKDMQRPSSLLVQSCTKSTVNLVHILATCHNVLCLQLFSPSAHVQPKSRTATVAGLWFVWKASPSSSTFTSGVVSGHAASFHSYETITSMLNAQTCGRHYLRRLSARAYALATKHLCWTLTIKPLCLD